MQNKFIYLFRVIYMVEQVHLTIKYQRMGINFKEKRKKDGETFPK